MNERDMEYLGNINTSPGPNAGRSIDPTKPQIEDAPKATPFIPTWEDPQSDAEPSDEQVNAALPMMGVDDSRVMRLWRECGLPEWFLGNSGTNAKLAAFAAALAQSDAEPLGILHNKEAGFKEVVTRDTPGIYDNDSQPRLVEEIFDFDRQLIGFRVYDAADTSGK